MPETPPAERPFPPRSRAGQTLPTFHLSCRLVKLLTHRVPRAEGRQKVEGAQRNGACYRLQRLSSLDHLGVCIASARGSSRDSNRGGDSRVGLQGFLVPCRLGVSFFVSSVKKKNRMRRTCSRGVRPWWHRTPHSGVSRKRHARRASCPLNRRRGGKKRNRKEQTGTGRNRKEILGTGRNRKEIPGTGGTGRKR